MLRLEYGNFNGTLNIGSEIFIDHCARIHILIYNGSSLLVNIQI